MQCVRIVSYSIRINGVPRGNIFPSRGIRQGDPLSPYLFISCAEGLSSLINSQWQMVFWKELLCVVEAQNYPIFSLQMIA